MRFGLLGRLEASGTGGPVALTASRQRALLAALLLESGRVVSSSRLVERLWEERAPATAAATVQGYVSLLRRALEAAEPGAAARLVTEEPGYRLVVEPGDLDLSLVQELRIEGSAAAQRGDWASASTAFDAAADLWRATPLEDLGDYGFARRAAIRLDALRLDVLEARAEARLALGRHSELAGELEGLARDHPLRESLWGLWITALYRCGRQAEALAAFGELRRTLAAELGLEPSTALRQLEGSILVQDPALGPPPQPGRSLEPVGHLAAGAGPDARPPQVTRYALSGGLHVAYQVVGAGPIDIVFVPGFVSNVEAAWDWPEQGDFLRRLAEMGRLILFDKRGTGLSDPVDGAASLEERMDDVRAVMDAAGSRRAVLFGFSEGAALALLFAATHPSRTLGLVVHNGLIDGSTISDAPEATRPREDDPVWHRYSALWGTGRVLARAVPSIAGDPVELDHLARFERHGASPAAAYAIRRLAGAIDARHVCGAVRVPVLVMHGTGDVLAPIANGRYMASHLGDVTYVELDTADHPPWIGRTPDVLEHVGRFVTQALPRLQAPLDPVLAAVLVSRLPLGERGRHIVEEHHGRPTGASMATFGGPVRALRCGLALCAENPATAVSIDLGLVGAGGEPTAGGPTAAGIANGGPTTVGAAAVLDTVPAGSVITSAALMNLVGDAVALRPLASGAYAVCGPDDP